MQDIRICFVGDSFVNGFNDRAALGWAGRLCADAARLGNPVTYYNLGIRRNTSKDIATRWQQECALRLPQTCDGRIVLSCGVNDAFMEDGELPISPEESIANVRAILHGAKAYRVFMVGPPPVDDDEQNERIATLSAGYAREAAALEIPYVDLLSPLVTDDSYRREIARNDGAHPGSGGYSKMANIIASSQAWWFKERPSDNTGKYKSRDRN